ncbi:MAG: SUMF1/EgtB/PvdO family nonheme iron enzyme [Candidatus Brocadiae bacterium]|nr:SUMF1/EgtB/PvdO family nonheme iron enzyme [Candidatus Brocadiia bacterium]
MANITLNGRVYTYKPLSENDRGDFVGKGAFAQVYKATASDNSTVALKILNDRPESILEKELLQRLNHRYIVRILDAGRAVNFQNQEMVCLVMNYVEGQDLFRYSWEKDQEIKISLMLQISSAIQYAHEKQILHRDLKPSNILVDKKGEPCVLDFGIAKWFSEDRAILAHSNTILGTPAYMSPEQFKALPLDSRCDVWALGVILYQILCGYMPFPGNGYQEFSKNVRTSSPKPIPETIDSALQNICLKALEKNREERFQSAAEFGKALRGYLKEKFLSSAKSKYQRETEILELPCDLYLNNAYWPARRNNLLQCQGFHKPVLPLSLFIIGNQDNPECVFLAYPKPQGNPMGLVQEHQIIALSENIIAALKQANRLSFLPSIPSKEYLYVHQDAFEIAIISGNNIEKDSWPYMGIKANAAKLSELLFSCLDSSKCSKKILDLLQASYKEETVYDLQNLLQEDELGEIGLHLALTQGTTKEAIDAIKKILDELCSPFPLRRQRVEKLLLLAKEETKEDTVVKIIMTQDNTDPFPEKTLDHWKYIIQGKLRYIWIVPGRKFAQNAIQVLMEMPQEWPIELWEKCWNSSQGYLDCTQKEWEDLTFLQQSVYIQHYQELYSQWKNIPVEKETKVSGVSFFFRLIPPVSFWMGFENEALYPNAKKHKVILNSPYYMGKFPVAQFQWQAFMKKNPSYFKGENRPVENIPWHFCIEFCQKTGFKLPTEAQWEYAARGGTNTLYYWGDRWDRTKINSASYWMKKDIMDYSQTMLFGFIKKWQTLGAETTDVGQFRPNAFGLHDMLGNVWEWSQDSYAPYSQKEQINPVGPAQGIGYVIRGGSWANCAWDCSCAYRDSRRPECRENTIGFRVCSSC